MKLIDIILNVDRSNTDDRIGSNAYTDLTEIANAFDIYDYLDGNNSRITSAFYSKWLCTDSYVGGRVYFLDDTIIAISYQGGRKSSEKFKWVSKALFEQTHSYLLSLLRNDIGDFNFDLISGDDYELEMNAGYHIEFSKQILTDNVILAKKGSPVKIIDRLDAKNGITSREIKVKLETGEEQIVSTNDILVPYLLQT